MLRATQQQQHQATIVPEAVAAIKVFIGLVKEYGPGAIDDFENVVDVVKDGITKAIAAATRIKDNFTKQTLEQTLAALEAGSVQLRADMDAVDAAPKVGQQPE